MSQCWLYNNCSHVDCDKFCVRRYKLDNLYNYSLLSDFQRVRIPLRIDADGTDLSQFKQLSEIENNINEFVENGKHLFIHSTVAGNGKTSWAIRMIQSYLDKNWAYIDCSCHVLFVDVPKYLSALKDNISAKNDYVSYIRDNIESADLVVFDEIASKVSSEYEIDKLFTVINARINAGKSNIYTSNRSTKEFYDLLGERLTSRICNGSIEVVLNGADKRKNNQ